jgi:hypothetical protein
MNNSKTPKIVVGVGLAAVYATIAAFVIPRGDHDTVVAQGASAPPAAEIASEPALPPAMVSESPDASLAGQPAPDLAAAPAAPVAPVAAAPKAVEAPAPRKAEVKPQVAEQQIAAQEPVAEERPIASVATVPPAAARESEDPSLATAGSAEVQESEATDEVASQVESEATTEVDAVATDGTGDDSAEADAALSN